MEPHFTADVYAQIYCLERSQKETPTLNHILLHDYAWDCLGRMAASDTGQRVAAEPMERG